MSSPWKDFPNNKTERPFEGIPAGQEPEVMPGFTAPATDPWPPLSREQVVELHEALIEFLKAPMKAPTRLAMRLLALNIGTPPQPRRWTNDDIQAALEKREEPTASLVSSPLGVKPVTEWVVPPNPSKLYVAEVKGVLERGDVAVVKFTGIPKGFRESTPEEAERLAVRWRHVLLNRIPDKWLVPEEVKHNCGTCRHNQGLSNYCALMTGRFERHDVEAWIGMQQMSDRGADEPNMPPKDSTSCCPGWEPTP